MKFLRRDFVKAGAAGAAMATMPAMVMMGATKRKLPLVGVQLFSVRNRCGKDLVGTLKAIKKMGYAGVEFANYYGKSADELKKILNDLGLVACGAHTGLNSIKPVNINKTIDFSKKIGNKYLIVSWMNSDNAQGWVDFAKIFNEAAVKAATAGMYVGYHNHQHEFKDKFDGKCKWEIFFENASPKVCMQLDVGHVVSADEDPVHWFKRFPMRSRTIHAKEIYPGPGVLGQVPEGKTGVDWDAVFKATDADVTEWYIVESEADPNSLDNIRGCIEFLKFKGRA